MHALCHDEAVLSLRRQKGLMSGPPKEERTPADFKIKNILVHGLVVEPIW